MTKSRENEILLQSFSIFLSSNPLCLPSEVLAKWMLCLQHVIQRVCFYLCAQVRLTASALLPWQQLLGKCVFSVPV